MKLIFSFLALLVITKECESHKTESTDNELNAKITSAQNDGLMIVYTQQTRGFFESTTLSKNEITVSKSRSLEDKKTFKISNDDWAELTKLVSILPIEKLTSLAAPTDKRIYDGAAMATLKLTLDSKEIETPTFDHGYPPKAIEALVNKVLSIKENVVKD